MLRPQSLWAGAGLLHVTSGSPATQGPGYVQGAKHWLVLPYPETEVHRKLIINSPARLLMPQASGSQPTTITKPNTYITAHNSGKITDMEQK